MLRVNDTNQDNFVLMVYLPISQLVVVVILFICTECKVMPASLVFLVKQLNAAQLITPIDNHVMLQLYFIAIKLQARYS